MNTLIAYVAGVIDGEGCLGIWKHRRKDCKNESYRGHLRIANTHVPMLKFVKKVIGGKIVEHTLAKDNNRSLRTRRCYELCLTANETRTILPSLLPYLVAKKDQAEVLMAFLKRQSDNSCAPISKEDILFYENSLQKIKSLKAYDYIFKEESKSFGLFNCVVCNTKFERTSRSPKRIYCKIECKKKNHWTRSNKRIRLGIPAWSQ